MFQARDPARGAGLTGTADRGSWSGTRLPSVMDRDEAIRTLESRARARARRRSRRPTLVDDLDAAQTAVLGSQVPSPRSSEPSAAAGGRPQGRRTARQRGPRRPERRRSHERRDLLEHGGRGASARGGRLDVTLARAVAPGPARCTRSRSSSTRSSTIFTRLGFRVAEGPEVEDDWHNFQALNIPPDHPARTMKDSIFVDVPGPGAVAAHRDLGDADPHDGVAAPPVYVVAPGRVFRRETPDATHSPVFHQVEGLAVDEGITFARHEGDARGFVRELFGSTPGCASVPSYFPFVEPGAQVDVSCFACDGVGCRTCGNGWIELLGAGMVHPTVLRELRVRPRAVHGVRVRHGDRPRRAAPVRDPRHPHALRRRRAVPRAVRERTA